MKVEARAPLTPLAPSQAPSSNGATRAPDEFSNGHGAALRATALSIVAAPTDSLPAGDPYARMLKGLKYGAVPTGKTDTRIRQLQSDLMSQGYLPGNFDNDAAYGKRFGPTTRSALQQLQSSHGLEPTGELDDATLLVLQNAMPETQPQLRAAAANFPQLGQPVDEPVTGADGMVTQQFENGSALLTPEGDVAAFDERGAELGSQHVGTFASAAAANDAFVNQDGNTPWFTPADPKKPFPFGHNDCGPTSALMALTALGLVPHPSAALAPVAVDQMRDVMLGFDSTTSQTMGFSTVEAGLEKMGATCTMIPKTNLGAIDAALGRSHPVLIGGDPANAWGPAMLKAGTYGDTNAAGTTDFGHFCCVLGQASDGNYIVGDPLSKTGAMEVTPKQLAAFMSGSFGAAMEVAP